MRIYCWLAMWGEERGRCASAVVRVRVVEVVKRMEERDIKD